MKQLSESPINARDGSGAWVEIDTTLERVGDAWAVEAHPLQPEFSSHADESDAVTVTRAGHELSFSLVGADAGRVESPFWFWDSWDEIAYRDVSEGIDLEYTVEAGGIKEELVLAAPPEVGGNSWTWRFDVGGLTPSVRQQTKSVEFADSSGAVIFTIPTPMAWDSADGPDAVRAELPLSVELEETAEDGVWLYTLTAARSWLDSDDRVYPVHIDPELQAGPTNTFSYKSSGGGYSDRLLVGRNGESPTNKTWRSIFTVNYGNVPGKFIVNAQVGVGFTGAEGTSASLTGSVRHASAYSYSGTGTWLENYTLGGGETWTSGEAVGRRLVERFAVNDHPAFMLTGDEGANYSLKRVGAAVYIWYWDHSTISHRTPGTNATGVSVTPTLIADHTNPVPRTQQYMFDVATDYAMTNIVASSGWNPYTIWQVPEKILKPDTKYYWRASLVDDMHMNLGQSTLRDTGIRAFVTNKVPAPAATTASPGADAGVLPQTVTTLTPELIAGAVTDTDTVNDGGPMKYRFQITTGADGKSGAIAASNWLTATNGQVKWTVPKGALQDGGVYTWVVHTHDGKDPNVHPTWTKRIKTDLRLGASGPSPFDTAGPVTVNLANGNANMSFASPTVQTMGGPMGMSFTYNSQETPGANSGLTASYYDARINGAAPTSPAGYTFDQSRLLFTRTDPSVSFDWGTDVPLAAVPSDHFLVRWEGLINLPAAYLNKPIRFGVRQDDGAKLRVNDEQLVDNWVNTGPVVTWSSPKTYSSSNTDMKFQFDYFENINTAVAEAWVKIDGQTEAQIIPADWFTRRLQVLPAGWGASTPIAGASAAWASATLTDSVAILTDATGKAHTYQRTASGFTPPAGEYGTVSLDADGLLVFTDEDGTVFHFSREGRVVSATSSADGLKPAAPLPVFDSRGLVTHIHDPVSKSGSTYSRSIAFTYQSADGSACPEAPDADIKAPPVNMLCKITYPDNTFTTLRYNQAGQLVIITDPGNETTTFAYDTGGYLTQVRDSTANDAIAAGLPTTVNSATQITYDSPKKRVSTVTLPAPDGATASTRPMKTYVYDVDGLPKTQVQVAGLTGSASTVTYDSAWRQLSATSQLGVTATQEWDSGKDLVLSSSDSTGRKTTTIYDPYTDRATDTYGPAPAACFDSYRKPLPNASTATGCNFLPAHTAAKYDLDGTGQPMKGLHAAYYPNRKLAGKPTLFGLGIGEATGQVDKDWAGASPGTGIPATGWSLRLTGSITFPTAGLYTLQTNSDDGVRVWVGNDLYINRWQSQAPTNAAGVELLVAENETKRIRVEYFQDTAGSELHLRWKVPNTASFVDVPGAQLKPDYGLVAEITAEDSTAVAGAAAPSVTASFTYQHPWLGQATASTVDPAGLALKTAVRFEQPGASGWLRREGRTLPAGTTTGAPATAETKTVYYGDTDTAPAVCGIPAGTKQYGFTQKVTGPSPSIGTTVATEYAYDLWGRTVATKVSGDTAWSCTNFDARGRVTQQTIVGPSGTTTRTVTTTYTTTTAGVKVESADGAVAGSPNGSKLTTETDFLGRITKYTDVWNTVTVNAYENLTGRLTSSVTTPAGGSASTTEFAYDLDGKTTQVKVDGQVLAAPAYDTTQQLASVTYQGGSQLNMITRDPAGRTVGQQWTFPSATGITDQVTRSQSGRIVEHSTIRGSATTTATYGYDGAGRLITANIPGHQLTYQFAATGGCGTNTAAGASGNRTGLVDVYTAPGQSAVTTSTAYCYDWADRLTTSTVTNPITGANTVADGITPAEIGYDGRGNVTRLADMVFAYDSANRHVGTTYDDGSTVALARDATGRVVSRTVDPAGAPPAGSTTYVYAGGSDLAWSQKTGTDTTRLITLPGGVTVSMAAAGNTFAYPSLQGHTLATGNGTTTASTGVSLYDPYGQPLHTTTLAIGTAAADDQVANDRTGWHQGALKISDTAGSTIVVEMGARLYVPALGRFLQVDPVEGGVDNDYVWPTDPIGSSDLTGRIAWAVVDDAADFVAGGLAIASLFGCVACGIASAAITVVRGAVRLANGDATGLQLLGTAALGGVGKAMSLMNRGVQALRSTNALKGKIVPPHVRAIKRDVIRSQHQRFERKWIRGTGFWIRQYSRLESAVFVFDRLTSVDRWQNRAV